jgi:hypothetical protein
VEDSYQETCKWVTTDQPVAIMDSWIQCRHSQEIFHLTDQVFNYTLWKGNTGSKAAVWLYLACTCLYEKQRLQNWLSAKLPARKFHFEEFVIETNYDDLQLFEVIAVCVN